MKVYSHDTGDTVMLLKEFGSYCEEKFGKVEMERYDE